MKSGSFQRVIVIKQKTQLFLLLKIIGNKKHLLSSYSVSGIIGTLKTSLYLSSEQHTTIISTIRKMLCILKVPSSFLFSEEKKTYFGCYASANIAIFISFLLLHDSMPQF